MDVATISVISSALVAVASLAATFIGGERQRRHESSLDFERRVWDRKSEALFTLIRWARSLADSDDPITDDNRKTYAMNLSQTLGKFLGILPTVEAFASSACRQQLTSMIEFLRESGIQDSAYDDAEFYNKQAFSKSPLEDSKNYWNYRDKAKEVERMAAERLDLDLEVARQKARDLIDAARESARRALD